MKNRWKNAWKALRGNRGSGVLLVMVAIACITLMAVSLLHLSYTAFKMKAAERQSKIDFYMTDSKMDELLAGVQKQVSVAIAQAQKVTLIEYKSPSASAVVVTPTPSTTPEATQEPTQEVTPTSTPTPPPDTVDADSTERFQEAFLDELEKWVKTAEGTEQTYDVTKLKSLLSTESANVVEFTSDADCTYVKDTENKQFILQNVRITYTSQKSGYSTSAKFDIVIEAPDFLYVKAGSSAGADTGTWNIEELVRFENWSTY